nr:hypothetical protein [Tanacetum cinerariifolium]
KRVVITKDIIRQDLRLDDADGVECLPTKEIFSELAHMGYEKQPLKLKFYKNKFSCSMASAIICLATVLITNQVDDLSSHITKYTSPALTQKVFANMRKIGKGFFGIETPLFDTMMVQPQAATEEEDEDDETRLLEILKLKRRVKKLEKQRRSKSFGFKRLRKVGRRIEEIDADEEITLVDIEIQDDLGAELQERLEEKDEVNANAKEVNVVEPTVFDDEEVKPIFKSEYNKVQTFLKSDRDEEPTKERGIKETLLQESFKKLRAEVEVSCSHSTQDTPTDDPKEMSKEDVKNMLQIVPVSELKVEALQVKYPLIDWEIYSKGSRTYWKIIRVGGITQAYKSFEDMVKDFDKEDLDALWRLTKEKFNTAMPTKDKEKA